MTYGIKVEDGVVTGYINYVNTNKETVAEDVISVALPEGAFAEAVKPAAITEGTVNWATAYATGAKFVTEKAITDITSAVVIDKAPFTADDWTIVSGTTGSTTTRQNTEIAADGTYIQLGASSSDVIVKHAKAFTGSDFYIEYVADRQESMGNDKENSERFGVRVGDFYFP